jgi:protein-tyrosine-phosphatase
MDRPEAPNGSPAQEVGERLFPSKRLLFICSSNVGRSQMAEGIFRNLYPDIEVASAGIGDISAIYPDGPHPAVVAEMAKHGIDIASQKVKQITPEMVTPDTDVVVFCNHRLLPDYVLENARSVIAIDITDPGNDQNLCPLETMLPYTYKEIYKLINEELRDILQKISDSGHKSKIVIDPYIVFPYLVDLPTTFPRLIQPWETVYDYSLNDTSHNY